MDGTNTWGSKCSRWLTTFKPGTRYRLRLVNAAVDQQFHFMIDNHTLEVISNDCVPIIPTQLSIGMDQWYNVIVIAKELTSGNFWLRAIPQEACAETNATDKGKGIIRHDNFSTADLKTSAYSYVDSCAGQEPSNLIPYLASNASDTYTYKEKEVEVQVTDNALLWLINKSSF